MNTKKLQKKEAKRQHILEAAIRVFARYGFQNTSVAKVAREADIADGTVYLYFKNKDELLVSIFNEAMTFFVEQTEEAVKNLNSAPEKLRAMAHLHLKNLGENEDITIVFQVELRNSVRIMKKHTKATLKQYLKLMETIIVQGQKEGSIRNDFDPKIGVQVFFGALDEMATNWILRTRDYSLESMCEPVLDILLNGFKPGREVQS